jgi:hypothetical protein
MGIQEDSPGRGSQGVGKLRRELMDGQDPDPGHTPRFDLSRGAPAGAVVASEVAPVADDQDRVRPHVLLPPS